MFDLKHCHVTRVDMTTADHTQPGGQGTGPCLGWGFLIWFLQPLCTNSLLWPRFWFLLPKIDELWAWCAELDCVWWSLNLWQHFRSNITLIKATKGSRKLSAYPGPKIYYLDQFWCWNDILKMMSEKTFIFNQNPAITWRHFLTLDGRHTHQLCLLGKFFTVLLWKTIIRAL